MKNRLETKAPRETQSSKLVLVLGNRILKTAGIYIYMTYISCWNDRDSVRIQIDIPGSRGTLEPTRMSGAPVS